MMCAGMCAVQESAETAHIIHNGQQGYLISHASRLNVLFGQSMVRRRRNEYYQYLLHVSAMISIKQPLFWKAHCLAESKAHPSRLDQSYRP